MRLIYAGLGVLRLALVTVWILLAVFEGVFLFFWLPWPATCWIIRMMSRLLLLILGVRLRVDSPPVAAHMRGMLVGNHTSWLDIFAVDCVQAVRFVSKSEVATWPVLGMMVRNAGTIFVVRGSRQNITATNAAILKSVQRGDLLGFYPEGTTTDGTYLLPFKASLFQPAIDHGFTIFPVTVQYRQHGQATQAVMYIGETSIIQSMWQIVTTPGLTAHLVFLPSVEARDFASRQALAQQVQTRIAAALGQEVRSAEAAVSAVSAAP